MSDMLIKKSTKIEEGDVITLRLVTGEEVVGKLDMETPTSFIMERPLTLASGPDGLGFTNPTITADASQKFSIQKKHVMLSGMTNENFTKAYLEATSSIKIL
jgi:hypothetical protein